MTGNELRQAWPEVEAELKVGDIILLHARSARRNFVRATIQKMTQSYWAHSMIVYATSKDLPLGGTLIVESNPGSGVEMHHLSRYTDEPDRYDIGVIRFRDKKRYERDAFVKSFMVNNIDVRYDMSLIFGIGLRIFGKRKDIWNPFYHPSRVICSTFAMKAGELTGIKLREFDAHLDKNTKIFSPADLARSDNFLWVFNRQI